MANLDAVILASLKAALDAEAARTKRTVSSIVTVPDVQAWGHFGLKTDLSET